jgi:hypothetical protein
MTVSKLLLAAGAASALDFAQWKTQFGKEYKSEGAEASALATFAANDVIIAEHNAKGLSYWLGHNEFSDLTADDFTSKYVGGFVPRADVAKQFDYGLLDATVTAGDIDWVAKGAVTPIKDQAQCGSCWAFSTTGSIEGAFQIAGNNLTSLSEQQLVSCDNNPHGGYDNGCNGGLMDQAFKFVQEAGGLCKEADYPYISGSGRGGFCEQSCAPAVTITNFTDVPGEGGMLAAISKGPVSVAIEADKNVFHLYAGGVLDSPL